MHRRAVREQGGNLWDAVPAGLPSPGDGVVHDVISHQEECLQLQGTQSPVSCKEKGHRVLSCTLKCGALHWRATDSQPSTAVCQSFA